MKKRFISLVAAAALVGGVAAVSVPVTSQAGTVAVKGDTAVQMYGFVWAEYNWINQAGGDADHSNMPIPDANAGDSKLYQATYDKTKAETSMGITRIGFTFKNEDANLTGKIEGGFAHAGDNYRLRLAYAKHQLKNFYVEIGQDWILEENFASISASFQPPAGFGEGILRKPQVRVGTNLDMGSANLDLALAFEWENNTAVSTSDGAPTGWTTASVNRYVFPATVAKGVLHFETGFGAPAKFYAWGSLIPVYVSADDSYVDESETSYAFGTGVSVPVSMVTIGGNFQYSDGATNYAGVSDDLQPASYYVKGGDDEDTEMYAWNANVQFKPMPYLAVGAEYDYVEFKNDSVFTNGDKPEVQTFVGNVKINTTKYTQLTLEWRHVKAEDFDKTGLTDDDSFSGDQVYALYKYNF